MCKVFILTGRWQNYASEVERICQDGARIQGGHQKYYDLSSDNREIQPFILGHNILDNRVGLREMLDSRYNIQFSGKVARSH